MDTLTSGIDVLFIAGFGPITTSAPDSAAFYVDMLQLPLKPYPDNPDYLLTDALDGAKHFALWPLAQASESCFGDERWPEQYPVPQSWLEFEVSDLADATQRLKQQGISLLVENRLEPWQQRVTRFLSPEGILVGLTVTPWLRQPDDTQR
ncbi:glyoxalase [Lonsdalea britannica]|uniref:VOC family protein n=1 Tax=Lonsdalea britannica TaxID=1082704 RepID=UPI000A1F099E|nr:VOC family protein [Lonsdalea britannica]OSN07975.1 glyoxalase [Lonsdalea britannica]